MEWLANAAEIAAAVLACIGALKIIARHTKWKWDDKALEAIEKPLKVAVDLTKKLAPKKKDK